ncbi:cAMP-dependent protein kinase catalytic subunit [Elysia marginata]|uniref:cAMP-dependent protein kinase catalytic subunit n=1 Tax=Elysia marginata TaxID=1093978 RepID=A0AAV4JF96_9GAST|nr:cAMP-dependent protein kinase catalytic subunit [Elysia marginata]
MHRSLSAENIAVDTEGHIVLFDLSFVTFLQKTDLTLFDGPPYDFLAPEMVKGEMYTKNVDWWALGVLIYFCMHKRMPFAASDYVDTLFKIIQFQPAFVEKIDHDDLKDLCKLVRKIYTKITESAREQKQRTSSLTLPYFGFRKEESAPTQSVHSDILCETEIDYNQDFQLVFVDQKNLPRSQQGHTVEGP